jgi:hypothetical protein
MRVKLFRGNLRLAFENTKSKARRIILSVFRGANASALSLTFRYVDTQAALNNLCSFRGGFLSRE